jgi:hypothetical protein
LELYISYREALLVMGEIVPLFLRFELKKKKSYSLWRKDYVVASKTRAYQREEPSSTTQ